MAEDIWTWLRSCTQCGKPHEWRWTCDIDHQHGARDAYFCKGGTWADPQDGHPYEKRLIKNNVDELQAEWEATHG